MKKKYFFDLAENFYLPQYWPNQIFLLQNLNITNEEILQISKSKPKNLNLVYGTFNKIQTCIEDFLFDTTVCSHVHGPEGDRIL